MVDMTTGTEYYVARSPRGILTEVNRVPVHNHPCYSEISSANKVSTSRRANSRTCAEARAAHALSSAIADEDGMVLFDVEDEEEEEEDEEEEDTDHGEDDMMWEEEEHWYRDKFQRLSIFNIHTQCVGQVGFFDVHSPVDFSTPYPATWHGAIRTVDPVIYTAATRLNVDTPFKLELEYMQSAQADWGHASGVVMFEDDIHEWIASRLSMLVLNHSSNDESPTLFAELHTRDGETIQGVVDLTGTFKEL